MFTEKMYVTTNHIDRQSHLFLSDCAVFLPRPDTPIVCTATADMLRSVVTPVERLDLFVFVVVRGRTTTQAMTRDTFDTGVEWHILVHDMEVLGSGCPSVIQVANEEEEHNRRFDQYSQTILSLDGPPPDQSEITFFSSQELEQMDRSHHPTNINESRSPYMVFTEQETLGEGNDYLFSFDTTEWTETDVPATIDPSTITCLTNAASPVTAINDLDPDDLLDVSTQTTQ